MVFHWGVEMRKWQAKMMSVKTLETDLNLIKADNIVALPI